MNLCSFDLVQHGRSFELTYRQRPSTAAHSQEVKATMRVSMLVRWCTVLTVALVAAACSDTATAPPQAPAARPHLSDKQFEQWLLDNGGMSRDGRGRKNKTDSGWTQDFVVDPTQPYTLKA